MNEKQAEEIKALLVEIRDSLAVKPPEDDTIDVFVAKTDRLKKTWYQLDQNMNLYSYKINDLGAYINTQERCDAIRREMEYLVEEIKKGVFALSERCKEFL